MRRIRILAKTLDPAALEALLALSMKADFKPDEVEVIESVGEPDPACDDEIFVVLASPETCANPELEKDLVAAQKGGGRRTICIWPADAPSEAEPPVAAQKYAYSVIPWDADKLRAVAADDDVLCFEGPDGQPLPKPETERNLCVDEKAKAK